VSSAQKTFYRVVETLPADAPPYTVMAGKKVLELVPCPSWNKGSAALHIMTGMGEDYLPVCFGDDVTDEKLFETFRGKGVTIRVRPSRNSIAQYYLKDQREVLRFLKNVCGILSPPEQI
jgi:trehalose-phosphatase